MSITDIARRHGSVYMYAWSILVSRKTHWAGTSLTVLGERNVHAVLAGLHQCIQEHQSFQILPHFLEHYGHVLKNLSSTVPW